MNKIKYSLLFGCLIAILFNACTNQNTRLRKYETKNYSIDGSHIRENVYRDVNGVICKLPFLPSGLFIVCEKNQFPILDNQRRVENIGEYPILDVEAVYKKSNKLLVKSKSGIKEIDIENPDKIESVYIEKFDGAEKIFDVNNVDKTWEARFVQNAFSLQDKRINREMRVDYSTPVVNGITRIGLYEKKFYFGETLHSYFVLDLKTDELIFFKDEQEYKNYCSKRIDHCVEVLEPKYLYD